jgi:hypothetical protein
VQRIFRPLTQGENYCTQHNDANDYKTDVDQVHKMHQSSKNVLAVKIAEFFKMLIERRDGLRRD